MGIHNLGHANQENSGFEGLWGNEVDLDSLNNGMYTFMLGKGRKSFKLAQHPASMHENANKSATEDKLQWTEKKKNGKGRILLNSDLGMYHNFTGDANGKFKGKFCPQLKN